MEFRKAVEQDVDSIISIINQAQVYLKEKGINQWQNNYPNIETVKNDISDENGYVLSKDDKVVATVVVVFDGDKNYDTIYKGEWISNERYAVVHRIAVDYEHKGLGLSSVIFKNIEELCLDRGIHSIRVDTHEENISMQKLLQKNKFQYCGIIYLEDRSKRMAFEKTI